jgi:hypothetical protein
VTLYLRGDNIDFEEVTRLLGVKPERVQRKGDFMVPGHPRSAIYKNNTWSLSEKAETDDVSSTFSRLMSKLSPGTRLCDIAGVTKGLFDVFFVQGVDDGRLGEDIEYQLRPDVLMQIAAHGLPVYFTCSNVIE